MVNYVHFILSGQCRLIEHILVRERPSYHGTKYELYDPENFGPQQQSQRVTRKIAESDELESNQLDKSIPVRIKKNKIYSITYCLFKSKNITTLFLYFFSLRLYLSWCTCNARTRIVFSL